MMFVNAVTYQRHPKPCKLFVNLLIYMVHLRISRALITLQSPLSIPIHSSVFSNSSQLSNKYYPHLPKSTIATRNITSVQLKATSSESNNNNNNNNSEDNKSNPKQEKDQEVNGSNFTNKNQQKREGKTGWVHNLPSSTSSFWENSKETSTTTNNTKNTEIRTGWLHNTKSPSERKKLENTTITKSPVQESGARTLLKMEQMKQTVNHRIISPPTFHACGGDRRAVITEHMISVPLDRSNLPPNSIGSKDDQRIDIYFSIVELIQTFEEEAFFKSLGLTNNDSDNYEGGSSGASKLIKERLQQKRASMYKEYIALKDAKDCLLYLQGGPGFGAPTPISGIGLSDKSSWLGTALGKGFKRIVLMDQRGTGRSTKITKQTLQRQFPHLFALDENEILKNGKGGNTVSELEQLTNVDPNVIAQVTKGIDDAKEYMRQFRADNIVKDAEAIKDALLLPNEGDKIPRPWGAALGQSYGGFCIMTYLSMIEHPPKICLMTGGIAPMLTHIDDLYTSLRERVKSRNILYYDRYPDDVSLVKDIVNFLDTNVVKLPSGGILTPRRFLQLGISLGGSPSSFASLHTLISSAFVSDDHDELSRAFLKEMDSAQSFDDHPIYYLMHESIYADASKLCKTTDWSAYKVNFDEKGHSTFSNDSEFKDGRILFSGETVFPWMSDGDYEELSGFGFRSLSHAIANIGDWGPLYDSDAMRRVLGDERVVVAAAIYYDDMYVDFDACMKVVKRGGPLEKCRVWITNDYQHSGLRDDGATIFSKLLSMCKGACGTPS